MYFQCDQQAFFFFPKTDDLEQELYLKYLDSYLLAGF